MHGFRPPSVKPDTVQALYLTCNYHPQQISVALRCSEQSLGSSGRAHTPATDLQGEEPSVEYQFHGRFRTEIVKTAKIKTLAAPIMIYLLIYKPCRTV